MRITMSIIGEIRESRDVIMLVIWSTMLVIRSIV